MSKSGKGRKRGRKSKYDIVKENFPQIEKWLKEGATERQIAENLNIAMSSWSLYKTQYTELTELIKNSRRDVVQELRGALIKKALGFEYEEKKTYIKTDEETGKQTKYVEITKKYSVPDVAAINLSLKNYDKENWANDPQMLELRKAEFEFKKQMQENENW